MLASALAGLGIAKLSIAECGNEITAGAFVQVLTGYALEPGEVHAVFPVGPRPSAKVRAFVDYMQASLNR
jgi:DNA-binding transcriptional LysR family regulator